MNCEYEPCIRPTAGPQVLLPIIADLIQGRGRDPAKQPITVN